MTAPIPPLPDDEILLRPWPLSEHGILAKHLPTGLVTIRAERTPAKSREVALRDLALLVAHRRQIEART